jgi:hypothetical protein
VRESHRIHAPASRHEPNLAASAQSVDGEKYLVPRQTGTLTYDLFEVTDMNSAHDVNHLIFYGQMLCHAPPIGEQNALLKKQ